MFLHRFVCKSNCWTLKYSLFAIKFYQIITYFRVNMRRAYTTTRSVLFTYAVRSVVFIAFVVDLGVILSDVFTSGIHSFHVTKKQLLSLCFDLVISVLTIRLATCRYHQYIVREPTARSPVPSEGNNSARLFTTLGIIEL